MTQHPSQSSEREQASRDVYESPRTPIFHSRRALVAMSAALGIGLPLAAAQAGKKGKKKRKKKKNKPFSLIAKAMTATKEVGHAGDTNGSGSAQFTVDPGKGTVCATFAYTTTTTPKPTVTGTHIHKGDPSSNGPIVIDFHGSLQECVAVPDKELLEDLKGNPGGYYANLHTDQQPNGAIRDILVDVVKE